MHKFFGILIMGISFMSCVPNTIMHKTYNRKLITSVGHFPSLGHVSIIKFDNEKIYNDSLSTVAKTLLDSIVHNNNSFEVVALKADSADTQPLNAEVLEIFNTMLTNHSISNIKIPPKIMQIINEHDQRFYMATLIEGFDRTGINYAGQVAESIVVGVLTLGLFSKTPYKKLARVMNFIIDKESMKVIYFSFTNAVEKSPLDIKMINKQYKKIIPPKPASN
jgi:hypothetical protein